MHDVQAVMGTMMSITGSQHFKVARLATGITMKGVGGGMMGLQTTVIFTIKTVMLVYVSCGPTTAHMWWNCDGHH